MPDSGYVLETQQPALQFELSVTLPLCCTSLCFSTEIWSIFVYVLYQTLNAHI